MQQLLRTATRPRGISGPDVTGGERESLIRGGRDSWVATDLNPLPSPSHMMPKPASQMRVAFSSIALNTGPARRASC